MFSEQIREKPSFAINLLASAIALSIFKNQFDKIFINLGFATPSLTLLGTIFVCLLAASCYMFALDFASIGFEFRKNLKIFQIFEKLGHFFYVIALIFPIGIFVTWLIITSAQILVPYINASSLKNLGSLISLLSVGASVVFSALIARQRIREDLFLNKTLLLLKAENCLWEAEKALSQSANEIALVQSIFALEFLLQKNLLLMGLRIRSTEFKNLVRLIEKKKAMQDLQPKLRRALEISEARTAINQSIATEIVGIARIVIDQERSL